MGATFEDVSADVRRQLNIGYGVQVSSVKNGLIKDSGIQRGFIILKINNRKIRSVDDIEQIYKEAADSPEQVLFISGIYPGGRRGNYVVELPKD